MAVPTITRNETDLVVICDRIRRLAESVNASREPLSADRTYYVATTGSDTSNDGLTSGSPFLTLQHAYDVVVGTLDLGGNIVTIQMATGTYTGGLFATLPWVGGGDVKILGDNTTPTNVKISPTTGNCIHLLGPTLPGRLFVSGLQLTPAASGFGILHGGIGAIFYGFLNHQAVSGGFHIAAALPGALLASFGPSTVAGGAVSYALTVQQGSLAQNHLVTVSGTPAFTFFANAQTTSVQAWAVQPSGSATGTRFIVATNSVINTNNGGANFFPGNAAGVIDGPTGGIYL